MPTPAEIRDEIEGGPFALELASFWDDVFGPHPTKQAQLAYREGWLKPDAAEAIYRVLADPTRRSKILTHMDRGTFLAAVASVAIALPVSSLTAEQKRGWELVLNMLNGANEQVDVTRPTIQGLLDAAVAQGLMSAGVRATLVNGGTTTQSRLEELGWLAVSAADIAAVRVVGG